MARSRPARASGWASASSLSGSGTSGVAWARAPGADKQRVTTRLASSALLHAPGGRVTADTVSVAATVFATLILAQWPSHPYRSRLASLGSPVLRLLHFPWAYAWRVSA